MTEPNDAPQSEETPETPETLEVAEMEALEPRTFLSASVEIDPVVDEPIEDNTPAQVETVKLGIARGSLYTGNRGNTNPISD